MDANGFGTVSLEQSPVARSPGTILMALTEPPLYLFGKLAAWACFLPSVAIWDLASVGEAAGDESRNHVNYCKVLFTFKVPR